MAWKLKKYVPIIGVITCKTGLRIGGSKDDVEIGGMDNPIIRHPLTKQPYIPGSSLKGKLRSLLEYREGKISPETGEPCGCARDDCFICRVFGPHKSTRHRLGPTRIIVRDARLTEHWQGELAKVESEGVRFAEVKSENWIDRRTGVAGQGGLRTQERIPSGTQFDFRISLRVFEEDDEQKILSLVDEGLKLLQQDYLGGSGTRGYGEVALEYKIG